MGNIYPSISEKLAELNIDIYHYEDIVRCYILARLNIQHSKQPDFEDGIHTAEFATEVSRYQFQPPDAYYHSPAFSDLCRELVATGMDRKCRPNWTAFSKWCYYNFFEIYLTDSAIANLYYPIKTPPLSQNHCEHYINLCIYYIYLKEICRRRRINRSFFSLIPASLVG
ncbi:MAG: hypothetical protein IJB17_01815 [Oscillospiraceae bacterium]|nr:hypothetical protein [Oscillospiraceae bacterium]